MPLLTLQQLAARERTRQRNRQLGALLAFMAGAVNAGGFLAVQRYTSHMTGVVSSIADDLVLGQGLLVLAGTGALLAFMTGAATTAILINWARRRGLQGEYALSLLLEAALLLLFGLLGANLNQLIEVFMPTTVLLLCFIMGLQNAIVTKISQAEIRTTHMTGVITDLGIELGRLLYWNRSHAHGGEPVRANRDRLRILALILGLFLLGVCWAPGPSNPWATVRCCRWPPCWRWWRCRRCSTMCANTWPRTEPSHTTLRAHMASNLGFFDLLAFITFSINAFSYVMRDIKWLRIITIVAMVGDLFVYYNIRAGSPLWVQFGMSALIIVINVVQLYVLWRESQASHFPGDAGWLYEHVFGPLNPGEFRRVLKLGRWNHLQEGEYVLRKGAEVGEVGFVVHGRLDATWGDTLLNTVVPGGLVGEISYLTGKHASADVSAGTDSVLFVLTHGVLDKIKLERPELHTKLMYVLGREVAQKLANSNHLVTASRF